MLLTRIESRFCIVGRPFHEFIIIAFYDGAGLVAMLRSCEDHRLIKSYMYNGGLWKKHLQVCAQLNDLTFNEKKGKCIRMRQIRKRFPQR